MTTAIDKTICPDLNLTSEEIERNELLTEWFKSEDVEKFLRIWAHLNPDYFKMELKDDLRQESFLWLLEQPINYIRELNTNKQWVGLLNRMIITPYKKGSFFRKFIKYSEKTLEYEEKKFDTILNSTHSKIFQSEYDEFIKMCIIEVEKLPKIERICLELYIKHSNEAAILSELRKGIWTTANNHNLKKILFNAIDQVQSNLIINGVISKKKPFVRVISYIKKYKITETNEVRIAENLLRLSSLLNSTYNSKWSRVNKVKFVLCNNSHAITSREIYQILCNYEPNLGKKYSKETAGVADISSALKELEYRGIVIFNRLKGIKKEYFFPDIIVEYINKVRNNEFSDEKVNGTLWRIFLLNKANRLEIPEIAKRFNLSVNDTQDKFFFANRIIQSLLEQRKINQLNG